jgi:hypothetical protein
MGIHVPNQGQTHQLRFAGPRFQELLGQDLAGLECVGDSALPAKDRTNEWLMRLNEVITIFASVIKVGGSG